MIITITIASILRFRFEKSFGVRVRIVKQKSIVNVDHIITTKQQNHFDFAVGIFVSKKLLLY